ncbi:SDR family NAD(P)-dependent oxidoreductase [Brevundimonas sp. S30B]|uniref:SDR family NAD(P)-dependent oxidoreductase n=1 Tax=unclassified Brevundimonas TaxID=2622653 RepID=UPI001071A326|nr:MULTISPECIES: SDR family NAD(P)-dependent oxidoreductase [unclassified Brevundimonas]QBX37002.1 SDR family NAD(P)-dependent oxidoreductase [Brevundimonas sp. MF30-B]TFW04202.1 SDR family NAD(P)-dependent oxidoreductase [Brevundimonas sp. S30B]
MDRETQAPRGPAVIVGASGGVGAALVRSLAARQPSQTIHALSRSGAAVDGAQAGVLDLEDESSIQTAAASVVRDGAPELVIVATGVLHGAFKPERSMRELSADHLLRDYRINAVGPALLAKHLLPLMPRDRRTVFAVLSARVGSIGDNRLGGWHAYRASKAGLNMILKTLAVEAARTHPQTIVCGLHPGTVDTELSQPFQRGVAPGKLFTPEVSAAHLLKVIYGLTPADSGGVFAWDGSRIPA